MRSDFFPTNLFDENHFFQFFKHSSNIFCYFFRIFFCTHQNVCPYFKFEAKQLCKKMHVLKEVFQFFFSIKMLEMPILFAVHSTFNDLFITSIMLFDALMTSNCDALKLLNFKCNFFKFFVFLMN